jgi:arylsulfatase A-like enzyme
MATMDQSARCRVPEHLAEEDVEIRVEPETKAGRRRSQRADVFQVDDLEAPWLGWLFIYSFVLFYFSASRCVALKALVTKYSSAEEYTAKIKAAALGLGFLEDLVCTTYFAAALWLFDTLKLAAMGHHRFGVSARVVAGFATFAASWLLFMAIMMPFVADLLLVVHRDMRFSSGLLATIIREREHLKDAPISKEEVNAGYVNAVGLLLVATFFALVRTCARWTDLAHWNPTHLVSSLVVPKLVVLETRSVKFLNKNAVQDRTEALEEGAASEPPNAETQALLASPKSDQRGAFRHAVRVAIAVTGLAGMSAGVVAVRSACSPVVAFSALNATLNEMFFDALQPSPTESTLTYVLGSQPWAETFIHSTELHELFGDEAIYRRTTGFQGELAFNVSVAKENPPNVLLLGVESFRFQDSRYLVGREDPSNLFKGTAMTITPQFDRWAKRGVAMRNIWSSNPTSRSLESLLFAQIPYDSAVKTGITGGAKDTNLTGLPQLFTAKGYETWFTTGSSIDLDGWDVFLPTHGFDTVWDNKKVMELAEHHLNISHDDWLGDAHRGLNWGIHDDVSFQLLGDLLVNQTRDQRERMARGEPKTPSFITHYTISSHAPFDSWPQWFAELDKPDFSAFYEGHAHADVIERYLNVRYFTDLELGKFMDRMESEGILNDTIVVIMGDHGQAPEADVTNTHEESMTRVAAAIVAEGRLGDAVGMVIEDAVEHYDILNTLADITGVPEGGFLQNGVGRSLKRHVPFGERVVFSNEPSRKMSIVRGHQRLRYDQVSDAVMLHDTEKDHAMNTNLFPNLPAQEQAEWLTWRDKGRQVTAYYTNRWDENCLLKVNCTTTKD